MQPRVYRNVAGILMLTTSLENKKYIYVCVCISFVNMFTVTLRLQVVQLNTF